MQKAMILAIIKHLENNNTLIVQKPTTNGFTILKITYGCGNFPCQQSFHYLETNIPYVCPRFAFPPKHIHTEGVLNIYDILLEFFNEEDCHIFFL